MELSTWNVSCLLESSSRIVFGGGGNTGRYFEGSSKLADSLTGIFGSYSKPDDIVSVHGTLSTCALTNDLQNNI